MSFAYMNSFVMPGLVPGIHEFRCQSGQDVDGRDKPGHDEVGECGERPKP